MKIRPRPLKLDVTDYPARVTIATGEAGNVIQVVAMLTIEDKHGFPQTLCHLKLSPHEACELAEELLRKAAQAAAGK